MQFIGNFVTFLIIPTGATTGQRITINLNNDGEIKVYNSTGNLVDEIGGSDGRIIAYDNSGTRFVAMLDGQFLDGAIVAGVPDTANAGRLFSLLTGSPNFGARTFIQSPMGGNTVIADRAILNLASGSASAPLFKPRVILGDQAGTAEALFLLSGEVIKTDTTGGPYTWQTPVLGAGWATGSSTAGAAFEPIAYRLDAEDNLVISGTFHATSTTPASPIFTLSAPYIPPNSIRHACSSFSAAGGLINSSTGIMVANDGTVNINNAVAIILNQNYCVHGTFPLYNIA